MHNAEERKIAGTMMVKRGIWFFMRMVLIIAALLALGYSVFTVAMRAGNLYILATEGLQLRAECILQDGPQVELREYFTEGFLSKDEMLQGTEYDNYTINNFDYRVEVEGISVWPWGTGATVTVVERMASISGSIHEDKKPANALPDAVYPIPEWEGGRYRLYFSFREDRWYIYQMVLIDVTPSEQPKRTPDMRMTPMLPPTATVEPVE